jgi:hypothetical protein
MSSECSIDLTAHETMWLLDRVRTEDQGTEEMRLISYRLLARLGSLFLELVQDDHEIEGTLPVVLTEAELWWCKDRVFTLDAYGSDKLFGVRLLRKIIAGLLSLESPQLPEPIEYIELSAVTVAQGFDAWLRDEARRYHGGPPL